MTTPRIPAPDRDLANVPPFLPPDSTEWSPAARSAFGTITLMLGAIVFLNKLAGAIIETRPGPMHNWSAYGLAADWLAASAGLCFVICGCLLFRKGTVAPAVFVAIGLVLAIASRIVTP